MNEQGANRPWTFWVWKGPPGGEHAVKYLVNLWIRKLLTSPCVVGLFHLSPYRLTTGQPVPLQPSACLGFFEYAGHLPAYGFFICSSLCLKCPSLRSSHDSLPLLLQILAGTLLFGGDLSHLCLLILFKAYFLVFFSIPLISLSPYVLLISIFYCLSP